MTMNRLLMDQERLMFTESSAFLMKDLRRVELILDVERQSHAEEKAMFKRRIAALKENGRLLSDALNTFTAHHNAVQRILAARNIKITRDEVQAQLAVDAADSGMKKRKAEDFEDIEGPVKKK